MLIYNSNMNKVENKNNHSNLFTKKINSNYKLTPFKILVNDTGKTKYLPPIAKE